MTYKVFPEGVQPGNMKSRDILKMIQDIRNFVRRTMPPQFLQSRHFRPFTVLPITISCPIIFSSISSMVWNIFSFEGHFSFGKSQKLCGTKSGLYGGWGLRHLGDVMFHQKTAWDMMHEQVRCHDEAANHHFPIAAAFWIIWIISMKECSKLNTKFNVDFCVM